MQMFVSLGPKEAADIVRAEVARSGLSVECVSDYMAESPDGHVVVTLVFEKYFMRNSSRVSLTVTLHNLYGLTTVYATGSGGGQGALFSFDWGASTSMENTVACALERYHA